MALSDLRRVPRNEEAIAIVLGVLKQRFGERFQTGQSIREQHAHTTTYIPNQAPDGVAYPDTAEEVQEIVRACAEHRVPVIPYGTGTSLEGHVNAPGGGISVDTSRMNRVVEVHAEDLDCVVEPGVTREALNTYLRDTGLFFPIDPGANASLGGMAATRASGTNAVRYGTMRENVLGLTAVMADGSLIKTAQRAKKSSAGYDLTRLIVGSEGTLGADHVADAQTVWHPSGDCRRRLPVSERRDGLPGSDRDNPDGHSSGAHRTGQSIADAGDEALFRHRLCRGAVPVRRVPRQRCRSCRAVRNVR